MNEANQPETGLPANYQVGSITTRRRPEEMSFPLTNDEFKMLCDGAPGRERAGRDLCIGLCIGAAIGLLGIIATVDWASVWTKHGWASFISFLLLFSLMVGAGVGWGIYWCKMSEENTPCARLEDKISKFFEMASSADTEKPQAEPPMTKTL
jgi:hypothetical protein